MTDLVQVPRQTAPGRERRLPAVFAHAAKPLLGGMLPAHCQALACTGCRMRPCL